MLVTKASRALLRPGSGAAASRLLGPRGFAQGEKDTVHPASQPYSSPQEGTQSENTYDSFKQAAKRTGDAAQEWLSGSKEHGSAYEKTKSSAGELFESTKRATQDITTHAKEAISRRGLKDVKNMAADAAKGATEAASSTSSSNSGAAGAFASAVDAAGERVSEAAGRAAEAAKEQLGGGGEKLESAHAAWHASRDPDKIQQEQSSRKGQLTDEAFGNNPQESTARDDKNILPSDFYTKH